MVNFGPERISQLRVTNLPRYCDAIRAMLLIDPRDLFRARSHFAMVRKVRGLIVISMFRFM
jgi:hypothetical protein